MAKVTITLEDFDDNGKPATDIQFHFDPEVKMTDAAELVTPAQATAFTIADLLTVVGGADLRSVNGESVEDIEQLSNAPLVD